MEEVVVVLVEVAVVDVAGVVEGGVPIIEVVGATLVVVELEVIGAVEVVAGALVVV